MGWHLTQLGFRGECHMDLGVARSIAAARAEGIILELGINIHNFQTFRQRTLISAILGFLQTIREGHPRTRLIVVSPVFGAQRETEESSVTLDGDVLSGDLTLPMIRQALKEAVATRVRHGDLEISYLDGLELLGPSEAALFPDGLHPNTEGTVLLTKRLAAHLGPTQH
jgi:lysophospholipase L1-like esterase